MENQAPELQEYQAPPKPERNWLDQEPNPWAIPVTLAFILLISSISLYAWKDPEVFNQLVLKKSSFFSWQGLLNSFSALFLHGDSKHLISNLFLGSFLSYFLFAYFGFMIVPVAAILMGALTNFLTMLAMPEGSNLLGFSGVVFWMGGCWLTLYFLIMTRIQLSHRLFRVITVGLMIFFPTEAFDPTVSYRAHFIGFLLGVSFAILFYWKKGKSWKIPETSPDLRASAIKV